ncbi:MAG: hypothetical protein BROFUL_00124, partial [Candidatus Brocadia fulgida]
MLELDFDVGIRWLLHYRCVGQSDDKRGKGSRNYHSLGTARSI